MTRRIARLGNTVLLCTMLFTGAKAGEPRFADEYRVKAAFLLTFARFVDWPDQQHDSKAPIVLAIAGKDPFGDTLEKVIGDRTVNGRRVVVRRISNVQPPFEFQILFISASEEGRFKQILKALYGARALTVSDIEGFVDAGGAVELTLDDTNKVRFEVNLEPVNRATLHINSQLLQLANRVRKGSRTP